MNRRRFLKYAGATAAVAGASAVGLDYLLEPQTFPQTNTTSTHIATPPSISDFHWQPTRVVNGKVYEAAISLNVQSENPPVDVSAVLEDHAPTIPARAYPAELARTLQLTQSQTGNASAIYAGQVTDLKGGKEYQLTVSAQDSRNNKTNAEFETPYVREYENMADRNDILVGAAYHPWFRNPCRPGEACHWDEWGNMTSGSTFLGTPLLGLYNSDDPLVIAKHIDWATGYGVDFFECSYWGPDFARKSILPLFQNPLIGDIKVSILYETANLVSWGDISLVNLNEPGSYSAFKSHLEYAAKNYFSHPSYLRIGGRPVIRIYHTMQIRSDITAPIAKLRRGMKDIGYEIYLIGDDLDWGLSISSRRLKAFDAITNYALPPLWAEDKSATAVRKEYSRWQSAAHAVGVEVIPSVYPGYDDRHIKNRPVSYGYVPRSTQFFMSNLKIAMEFVDRSRMLGIVSWDEWGEDSFIEPSVEDDFKYLQTLKDAVAGH